MCVCVGERDRERKREHIPQSYYTTISVRMAKILHIRQHFEQIRIDFEESPASVSDQQRFAILRDGFIQGIEMHRQLLRFLLPFYDESASLATVCNCMNPFKRGRTNLIYDLREGGPSMATIKDNIGTVRLTTSRLTKE
ncbi:hypothetical protein EVAR_82730_1 [Eumeta japonica]|uniref:Uncharacterized protein n=1 Tax=Eumeta variegata TaxID=151549 RepID=A0A4C1ZK64_EUMVA|nr:hypothetical protein EVAR_82730_1 [Eumeta japonica]